MKVIFLDIDGVLNNGRTFQPDWKPSEASIAAGEAFHRNCSGIGGAFTRAECDFQAGAIDPDCVAQLNRIIDATGAEVVLSSTWRKMFHLVGIQKVLEAAGFRYRLSDQTPYKMSSQKTHEINMWLDDHRKEVKSFLVIDDQQFADLDFPNTSIRPLEYIGLTAELADKAIEILNK